ncbi:MAG: pyridoxal-dependent decarboxylase [candidate division SR1 bacterium]|nr:pyridoxal-dependent decarboxylase [candidate division SR1 bacterium]
MKNIKTMLDKTVNIINTYYDHSEKNPVLKYKSPATLKKEINLKISQKGTPVNALFNELEKIALNSPKTNSKGFFNLLVGGEILPAVMAEMLAAVLNNTMHTYKSAGIHILIEQEVIKFFLKKIGYKNGDGIFGPGGSLTNMIALVLARNEKISSIKKLGIAGKKLVGYTSDQAHYSTEKFISVTGLGKDAIRILPTDDKGKMNTKILEETIISDLRHGYIPFFINATVGTTVLGAFDPIEKIAKIAKKYKLRLHTDAALGGGALLSKKHKHLLKGIEQSNSVSRSLHKMMNVPLLAAVLLVKDPNTLYENFHENADYLFQMDEKNLNPGNKSIQCGRRNDAFKVWTALKYLGEKGYEKRINQEFGNAKYAVSVIKKDRNLTLVLEPECINVCFQVKGKPASKICEALDKQGLIKVSYGKRKGEEFIRLITVNADMTKKDIDNFFKHIKNVKI